MAILDLQGLQAPETNAVDVAQISSYASTGGCCVPSPIHSGLSILCYDSYTE
ncbi:SapB/AmfS family lanthipeptide [Streptomyces sp. 7-21]|uniref:SapB/AmfS family lanthipeptide n=1 Tax=Streptomyces sp. 7-21 TaxID=2802283 RepID=UPI00191DF462|nr:SapB/AmfS family lanthipeptide [Streptomyces sp. 7-21]MBL1067916.1 SapB/AmfS family lanthipeptide [Streptomyces sp. 7-21]